MSIRSLGGATAVTPSSDVPRATWQNLSGKPEVFPPAPHVHPQADVEGLVEAMTVQLAATDPGDLTLLFDNQLI